jgi:hypothetical protein
MIYTRSRDRLAAIATADLRWMLLKGTGYTPDEDHDFVSAVVPASNEVTVTSYTRLTLDNGARTVNDTLGRIEYTADNPNWGTLGDGEQVTGLVLYEHVTDDTDSPLIGYWPLTAVGSDDVTPFVVFFTDHVIATLAES